MTQTSAPSRDVRQMLNKVPEVTIWFWVIKILCTTVGESFADWINMTLGVGLVNTAILFTVVFVVVLGVQMRLRRYVPAAYWLTVVVVSVTGTLYTDILTDQLGVPLWISTTVFSVLLAITFAVWWARERTLSIHSINTTPREGFYWFAVLVTFALGTATGDWTLELTGWGPGLSILLPLGLIALVTVLWRAGADPVLAFWVAYILTRPLGANIGDWFGLPKSEQGLGIGVFGTSLIFLGAILATVVYLSISRADVIEDAGTTAYVPPTSPVRRRATLGVMVVAAVATVGLLVWANAQPHQSALADEGPAPLVRQRRAPRRGRREEAGRGGLPDLDRGRLPDHRAGHAVARGLGRPAGCPVAHHGPRDRVGRRPGDAPAEELPGLDLRRHADRRRAHLRPCLEPRPEH